MGAISVLKKLNEKMPDSLKRIAAPVIRGKLIGNRVFIEQLSFLKRTKSFSQERVSEWQLQELRSICNFAYLNTVYCKKIFDEAGLNPLHIKYYSDLKKIPLLTRESIANNFNELQAESVDDYYLATTGESTGTPMKVNLDRSSIFKERAFIYSFWENFGYDIRESRLVTLRGVNFGGKIAKANPLYQEVILNPFLLSEKTLDIYLNKIESYKADFIQGYPSAIQTLCVLLKKTGRVLPRKIKCVFLISENIEKRHLDLIEQTIGCSAKAFYGHSERSVFAEQCTDDPSYRFNPFYGFTEIEEHVSGNIVCTGFLNKRMPLIRYALDDCATRAAKGYSILGHRDDSVLVGKNGERITQTALNFHDSAMDVAEAYQLVQTEIGKAECRILSQKKLTTEELQKIKKAFTSKTNTALEWRVVDDVPFERTARGKVKTLVSMHSEDKKE